VRRLIPVLIGLALTFSGCTAPGTPLTLDNTSWVVTRINDQATVADHQPTMDFSAGQVTGSAGCNRYTGAYTQTDNGISLSQVIITQLACDNSALTEQEADFTASLSTITKLSGSATDPEFRDAAGKVVLNLTQPPPDAATTLTTTTWSLSAITSPNATTAAITDSAVTLQIGTSNFTGSACNNFSGNVAIDGSTITFTAGRVTSSGCSSEELANQVVTVMGVLAKVQTWSISDSKLTLLAADGTGLEFIAS